MDYYNEIKNELIDNEINKQVKDFSKNKYELQKYYNVGKLLIEAQGGEERAKYGNKLIKEYSKRLTLDLGKGYSTRTLKYMRKFYLLKIRQPIAAQLSWSHYIELLKLKDDNTILYYINQCKILNLTRDQLRERIKNKEYERLPEDNKNELVTKEDSKVQDFIKNPILIKSNNKKERISEKLLQKLILEDIESFMKELGNNFCFIGSEYKIKIGNNYNFIDLLLFNIEFNCYVVIELKVTELKKEHIGQIEVYMNYIDKNVKKINHDNTIGIIICRKNNKFVMEYCSDKRILAKEYELV